MIRVAVLAAMALAVISGGASAQQFPDRPIKIVVTIPPGGAPDLAARLLAERMSQTIGQTVLVENRTGANGNVAGEFVARSTPDGYTLLLAADSLIAINPHVYTKMPFDTRKDLVAISSVASNQFFLAVNPSLPVNTLPEFVDYVRKAKSPLHYASGGNGSQHQLGIEMLKQRAGIDLVHVPYRGGSPAGRATMAGETQVVLAGASNAAILKAGKLRGLATTGAKRSPLFPDMPSIGEFYPGYDLTIWLGLFAPAGTPAAVTDKLRGEVQKAFTDPALLKRLNVTGALQPMLLPAAEFDALMNKDYEKYGKLVRDIGISIK
jgi:tripartite-type tricarboxylate transporter receptor subunit TctC